MLETFASFKYFNYRLWFFSNVIAATGMWMQRVAQDWLVLTALTNDSGTALGITTALQFLPILFLSPWAGLIADRMNLRRVIQATQVTNVVTALALGILVMTDSAQLWHVYLLALLSGISSTIESPARQTFVSELVPSAALPNAVALNSAAFNVARLLGPAISGLVIAAVGPGWVFMVNSALFVTPVIVVASMRVSQLFPMEHAKREPGQVRAGIRYVKARTDIIVIMVVAGTVSAFGMNFQMTSAVMAREVFHKGAGEYGLLGSVMAIGSLAGALLAAQRKFPRVRLVVVSAFLFGICNLALALAPSYQAFAFLSIPTGLVMISMITAANAAIQISTDAAMRGRVMSLYLMVYLGANPIGAPIIGWVADTFGARWSLAAGGLISMAVAGLAALWAIKTWDVRIQARLSRHPITTYGPRERAADLRTTQQTD